METRWDAPAAAFWEDAQDDVALQRFRVLVDAIDDGLYQLDADERFVAVNDALLETTGYDREELLGEHVSVLFDDGAVEQLEHAISVAAESDDGVAPFELTVRAADGRPIPHELRVSPLTGDGEVCGTVVVARDQSEERPWCDAVGDGPTPIGSLGSVLDEANVGVFVLDDEFEIAWIDETIEEYFGIDREAVVGRDKRRTIEDTIRDRVADPEAFEERVLSTYDDNSYTEQFECRVRPGEDEDERWLEHYSSPIESGRYAGGRIEFYYDITDRKRSENALRATEARFESLVDAVGDYAIFRMDPEGHIVSWNEGAEEIKGYEREEILGEHLRVLYPEEDRRAGIPEANLEAAAEVGTFEDEGWRRRADGTLFWASVSLTAVHDDRGDLQGFLEVTRDITDRREREKELESELQQVLGRISDAFFAVDDDLRVTHVNERAEQLLQHPEEELLDEYLWDAFPSAADLDEVADAFERALESQEAVSLELYYEAVDRWIEATLYPSETGVSVYFRDVTDRVERQRALEESRNELQALIELLPVGVFVADVDGRIVEWNDAAEEIWGGEIAESDSVAEYDAYDGWWVNSGDPVEPDEWPLARALRGEEVIDPDVIEIEGFDGQRRTVLIHGMPVRDSTGEVSRAVVTVVDITERREYQRKLEASNERLEQFAYAASHDLQEPLRMISSYLQLLQRRYGDALDEEGHEYVEFAVEGADRMRYMIDGLLEYSRVETRGDPFEPVELDAVLRDVLQDLRVRIEESDAEIATEPLPRVEGDPSQLRQVFQNLIDNAIEYSGDEPPRIDVEVESGDGDWLLAVRDEGVGIEPEDAERIFEVFHRLHSREDHPGTGLGLALCERIVERHGGDIWVDSEPGEGSTFYVQLPAVGSAAES